MNKLLKATFLFAVLSFFSTSMIAKENIGEQAPPRGVTPDAGQREVCNPSISKVDLDINNVRARLLGGGDLWWDLSDGRYIIPNVAPGEKEVSSIFAAAIWVGGYDNGGNLKIAAQTYRQNGNDFWPGPIDATGGAERQSCDNWDRHFLVLGENIKKHIDDFQDNGVIDNEISADILNWPARGNLSFREEYGYELPDQDLAPFFDVDGDTNYEPNEGDFPIIGVCTSEKIEDQAYADQMIWWVYNDKGNIHTETGGIQIGMEIQALAFAYKTNDEINNMSFYRYKLLNKAQGVLNNTYMGQWVDPDLGCWDNDYVGCDIDRALGIVYNGQPTDPDCADFSGGIVNGYGDNVPMLGVDYFQGPSDENGDQIGMSAFVYYNNDPTVQGNPTIASDFYGYLSGFWRDGLPIEFGGDGYNEGTGPTSYMFPSDPSDNSAGAWSECSEGNDDNDRRFVQSSGPFRLDVGATNEVIVGAVWIPEANYPCPSFSKLQQADDKAQGLFNNCFKLTDGPDAPDLSVVELDQQIILSISNKESSNNYLEEYSEVSPNIPLAVDDSTYRFQGYKIYQTISLGVPTEDLDNVDQARLIANIDIKDGVQSMINYVTFEDADIPILVPAENDPVKFDDTGIFRSLSLKSDIFTGAPLINHKKYYYTVVAYAYNDYETYNPLEPAAGGQQTQYIQGRNNIKTYTAIPHINTPENNGTVVNADYGDEPQITRIDGVGNSGTFLNLTEESTAQILAEDFVPNIVYASKGGPFTVKVINPLLVKAGNYNFRLEDANLTDDKLEDPINWVLTDQDGNQFFSDRPIDYPNEQIIADAGFSIQAVKVNNPGVDLEGNNGFIGATLEYENATKPQWFSAWSDNAFPLTDFLRTGNDEEEEARDPNQVYANVLNGRFYPYPLLSWKQQDLGGGPIDFVTPVWTNSRSATVDGRNLMRDLNNVDIVFTSDPALWSRCVVVNTYSDYFQNQFALSYGAAPFKAREDESLDVNGNVDGTGTGMSYFPGYAIDVETGERLNIFFGENVFYNNTTSPNAADLGLSVANGKDMIFNPSSETITPLGQGNISLSEIPLGGHHYIYVTKERYDGCAELRNQLDANASVFNAIGAWSKISWTTIPLTLPGTSMLPISEGLVPNDLTIKLRVNNTFKNYDANVGNDNTYPEYNFSFDGFEVETEQAEVATNALDIIRVVPNPYYAFSAYENGQNETLVKITNLPAKCKISIFSLDGRLIRTYNRFESLTNRDETRSNQIDTDLEWDLKNESGIVVSSGVYIIHIDAEGIGEKVVKWFGSIRQFDSTGL